MGLTLFKLINNREAWGMEPRKDGEATNQTEPMPRESMTTL